MQCFFLKKIYFLIVYLLSFNSKNLKKKSVLFGYQNKIAKNYEWLQSNKSLQATVAFQSTFFFVKISWDSDMPPILKLDI